MWYTKGALISLSHGFVKYQSLYDLLGSFILPYSIQFVYNVFIIVVINHNDRLSQIRYLRQPPHEKAEGRLFHGRNFPVFASQKEAKWRYFTAKGKNVGVSTKCETHLRHPLFMR